MAPRREGVPPNPVACNINMLSMSRFLAAIEPEDIIYALLPGENGAAMDLQYYQQQCNNC